MPQTNPDSNMTTIHHPPTTPPRSKILHETLMYVCTYVCMYVCGEMCGVCGGEGGVGERDDSKEELYQIMCFFFLTCVIPSRVPDVLVEEK